MGNFLNPSDKHCMHCNASLSTVNYTAYRWAINAGPELPLCDACATDDAISLDEINLRQWNLIPSWWPCWVGRNGKLTVERYEKIAHETYVMGFGVLALSDDVVLQVEPCDVTYEVAVQWDAPARDADMTRRMICGGSILFGRSRHLFLPIGSRSN
jgi:hypothetical protein